jgi:AraC-like DNA-binding protein
MKYCTVWFIGKGMVEGSYSMYYSTIVNESAFETLPDDLRLRFQFCRRYRHVAPTFPPLECRPYTVVAGVTHGEALIAFADRRIKPISLRRGEFCVLSANCARHTRSISPNWVDFIVAGFLFEIRGGLDLLNFFELPQRLDKTTNKVLGDLLEELLECETGAAPGRTDLVRMVSRQRIGYAVLEHVLSISTPKQGMLSARRILPAIQHMNDHFNDRLDVPGLVKLSGLSRTHFFRMFKSQTGTTPIEYVKRRRLREALLLLQESDLTVAEIGDLVGWPDPFYFSKVFKASIGVAPSIYRTQYRTQC